MVDHEYTKEITCPHCGNKLSDSWECDDDGEFDCDKCGGVFSFNRDVTITYCTEKVDPAYRRGNKFIHEEYGEVEVSWSNMNDVSVIHCYDRKQTILSLEDAKIKLKPINSEE